MRISRMNAKRTIVGGFVLAAASAAAVPAAAAHAGTRVTSAPDGTRVTSVQAGPQAGGHAARPMSTNGCSNGTVCMYTSEPGWFSTPEHYWVTYGCNNLTGEYGTRWVLNNQYGSASATLWKGKNCTGQAVTIGEGDTWTGDITPFNSISLNK